MQDRLTEAEIEEKLEDYVEVEDISKVPINSHVRYFVTEVDPKTGKKTRRFRMGGMLTNKDHADKFVILSNGKVSWSVQVNKAMFYKKLTITEIKEGHNQVVEQYKDKIKEQKKRINKMKDEIEELKRALRHK
jgi:gas vesicle protein